MSHLICSEIVINDLDILRKAVAGFGGLRWMEGQKSYVWYMRSGVNEKEYQNSKKQQEDANGACEHAIKISGASYEIGVVRRPDGDGWKLVFDPYDGAAAQKVGRGCELLTNAYSEAYIRDFAEKNGFMTEQSVDDEGNIVLSMSK
jgi:hypothetical protein